ncbi:hypothetical protein ANANG_G00071860 [Anguilla anguilla]|uniref:DNA/RNA non-specific endonuclease domain-containing protein n=1 Tax=Anguilla anguilla TaxID=7936 RepID=A0A9D3MQW4_ANGAN|nr:hypothetical protein ANANG_G00071860 [Anguilla anguilla]
MAGPGLGGGHFRGVQPVPVHADPRGTAGRRRRRGGSLRRICQRYGDKPRYATLYDRARRLPVYSAYTFKKSDGQRRVDTPWMYEPQLVSEEEGGNMKVLPPDEELDPLLEESQVVLQDFVDATLYQRSTLNPDQHQADDDDKAATYTLTNVVPLLAPFLEESWTPYLDVLRRRLNNFCRGTSYVVTGVAVSGGPTIRRGNADRLAVPRYLWSAYCCPRFDRNSPYAVRYKFPSHAAYGLNQRRAAAAGGARRRPGGAAQDAGGPPAEPDRRRPRPGPLPPRLRLGERRQEEEEEEERPRHAVRLACRCVCVRTLFCASVCRTC